MTNHPIDSIEDMIEETGRPAAGLHQDDTVESIDVADEVNDELAGMEQAVSSAGQ